MTHTSRTLYSFVHSIATGDMAAAADVAGVARTLKQQAGVRSLATLKDALALLAQAKLAPYIAILNLRILPRSSSSSLTHAFQASHAYCGGTPGVSAAAVGLHRNAATGSFFSSACEDSSNPLQRLGPSPTAA